MLNTFENAGRQHLRRKERERNLQAIYSLDSNQLLLDLHNNNNLAPAADVFSGEPLTKLPSPPPPSIGTKTCNNSRRCHRNATFLLYISVIVVVVLAILLSFQYEQDPVDKASVNDLKRGRYERLRSLILDFHVTERNVLEDGATAAGQALRWLAFEDTTENILEIRNRFSLATFYFSTHVLNNTTPSKWENEDFWLSSLPICHWHGVECLSDNKAYNRIKSLNLSANGLTGTIPPEIALLKLDLRLLDISSNSINGSIPDLSPLKNLIHLYLGPNHLTSTIPSSIFELSHLTHMYLNNCQLKGKLSAQISSLTKLQGLGLHHNLLSGSIPMSIGNLADLQVLYLDSNYFSGTVPSTIGSLTSLIDLRLRQNELEGSIPPEIAKLSFLQKLYLDSNELSGTIPGQVLGSLSMLNELQLYSNNLVGSIPEQLGSLRLMTILYLDENRLMGSLPAELGDLSYLEHFFAFDNILTGKIPTSFGKLERLEQFRINKNFLTGTLPVELSQLERLEIIHVQKNYFQGRIPDAFGQLGKHLVKAEFHSNFFTGTMPASLCTPIILDLTADCREVSCVCCTACT